VRASRTVRITTWLNHGWRYQKTHLFLHKGQLLKITFKESHLLLLRLAVAVANNVIVLFLDLIQLNFQLDNL